MKLIVFLSVCIIAANAQTANEEEPEVETRAGSNESIFAAFQLYTRTNPKSPQLIRRNLSSLKASNFNHKDRTVIIIHDWDSNFKDHLNTGLTSAFLEKGPYNVICVSWTHKGSYASSLDIVDDVAKRLAANIDFINSNGGMGFLQLFGHGVGAHIAGSVGHQLKSGRLGKITALDGSRPLINYNNINKRISPDDAVYVESIQTNGGHWGWDQPLGKANFYPNGGRIQPMCSGANANVCSHQAAVNYIIQAERFNNFKSKKCATPKDAHLKTCQATFSNVRLGGPDNYSRGISGNFFVPVNARSPYGTAAIQ